MNSRKTVLAKASLSIFLLSACLCTPQSLAGTWDVGVVGSYGSHGVLGYGFGLRVGITSVSGFYLGARFQMFPFREDVEQVPCECIFPNYELVETRKQMVTGGLESGLGLRIGRLTLRPTFLFGLALPNIESAFSSPADGPAIIKTQNDPRLMLSPGLTVAVPVSQATVAVEILYHNIIPFDSGRETIGAIVAGLSLGFSL